MKVMTRKWKAHLAAILLAGVTSGQMGAVVVTPATAEAFTELFAHKNDRTWSGGDQSTSFKGPNGKIYWISGDTILSSGEDPDGSYPDAGTTIVSNRILVQTPDGLENAMADGGIAVPDPSAGTAKYQEKYWAQGAFVAGGYLYLLCQRVGRDRTVGTLGFKLVGTELAKYRVSADGKLSFIKMVPTPSTGVTEGVGAPHIQWAADAIEVAGWIYIYGYTNAQRGDPPRAAHYSYLARIHSGQVENPAAWRFYRKSTDQWVHSAADLSPADGNPDAIVASQVSSVRIIHGKIVMVHKPWNGFGSAVYAEVGFRPEGPFSQVKLFESPAGTWRGSRYWTYAPMLHPEQTLTGPDVGKILVSINWNGQDLLADVFANADLYKPRFHAVSVP